ncbi:MAG TPA: hypothetical protein VLF89_10305 [Candidatus Saccharimonadales bacterium]|nr:hypothetical protein [Candidatus Saccharimonadales bacterium]
MTIGRKHGVFGSWNALKKEKQGHNSNCTACKNGGHKHTRAMQI